MFALGLSPAATSVRARVAGIVPPPMLAALTLSNAAVAETTAEGVAVGTVQGQTSGSALTLLDSAGDRFVLADGMLRRGPTGLDHEVASTHQITLRETLAGVANSPRETMLTIAVGNVLEQPNLAALTLSPSSVTVGVAATIAVNGATAGSLLSGTVPPGMTIDSAARTVVGTPTTTSAAAAWSITETLADSANSPRVSNGALEVRAPAPAPTPTPTPSAPISAVAADGWQAAMVAPAELSFAAVSVSRQGFSATGAAITIIETLLTTKRVRQPYPNQASLTASAVALSDYVYATDTIAGVTNDSAEVSPKPVCNWIMPHRLVVGNAIEAELVAFHRNASGGKQVACVEFIASDGSNSVSVKVSATAVSGRIGDRNAVVSYKASLDITGLAAGLITFNAKVYPRIGGAASIADSSADGNAARGFSPRYFLKSTAAKTLFYVKTAANGGNDVTGAGHINAATAAASPFATVLAAINAAHTALGGTSGVDLAEIRIGDDGGTPFVLSSTAATRTQKVAALTITRDPAIAKANARVSFGTAAFRPRLGGSLTAPLTTGALVFRDLTILRTGALTFSGEAAAMLELIFDDCSFDNATSTGVWLSNAHDYHFGTTFTNLAGNILGPGTYEHRLLRGCSMQPAYSANGFQIEGWTVVGCAINNPYFVRGTRSFSGGVVAFNTLTSPPVNAIMLALGADADVANFAIVQNVVEFTSATSEAVFRISGDNASGNNTHILIHQNSCAGAFQAGRWNAFYDEGATRRTSKLHSVVGNIAVAIYTKSDVFGANGAATGNWAFAHGVGCRDNFTQFMGNDAVAQGANQAQDYAGIGANNGTSQSVRNDPGYTSNQGTTIGAPYTAGAGGGIYTLTAGSAARAMVDDPVLTHGLGGAPRAVANDAAGAYAA